MDATFFALIGLIIFIGIVIYVKAPQQIFAVLDKRANDIRDELDRARGLREEAQALLAEYQRKQREAQKEAEGIVAEAKLEADRLTEETNAALIEMIERRTKAAQAKIAQAEEQAVSEVRARAADIAVAAASSILNERVDGDTARDMLDQSIKDIKKHLN